MPLVDLIMPKMGESIMEATILKWLKQPGDAVKQDETVLEIATDKVDSEVPSTTEGVLEELLFQVNDVVPIGSVIARIRTQGAGDQQATAFQQSGGQTAIPSQSNTGYNQTAGQANQGWQPQTPGQSQTSWQSQTSGQSPIPVPAAVIAPQPAAGRFYSPLVLNIAASEGVSMSELETMPGTGNEGRVTKKDILQYVASRAHGQTPVQVNPSYQTGYNTQTSHQAPSGQVQAGQSSTGQLSSGTQPGQSAYGSSTNASQQAPAVPVVRQEQAPSSPTIYSGNVEIMEMDRMRRLIADHMVRSKHTSPHVTSFMEADVTNLVHWRDRVKKEFEKREGTKITFTPLFIEAIVQCIKKYPLINSSVDGDKIIIKKDINIGMATALPSGNLIVPVIRNADQLNLVGLSRQVNAMADNARQNKLRPEDTQGGTFTMTNVGTFGSLMGTPIINQPQVAILAVGAIKKRPVVLETAEGDAIAIRHMMYLSLSYDHRIVDGSLGATFLTAVARALENFPTDRQF